MMRRPICYKPPTILREFGGDGEFKPPGQIWLLAIAGLFGEGPAAGVSGVGGF